LANLINAGRPYVIDAINFEPERFVIFYHLAEDDITVGGKLVDVCETHQLLIRPHVAVEDIDELQEAANVAIDNALRAMRRTKREAGSSDGGDDD
jgi:hypothetical protein